MKFRIIMTVIIISMSILQGCSALNFNVGPKKEVRAYSEKILSVEQPLELEIKSDFSNTEIYGWDKYEVKFEITKKVRGIQDKKVLAEKLEDFDINISQNVNKVEFKSEYKGSIKSPADKSVDLRVFIPRKTKFMVFALGVGSMKFYDDIKGELKITMDMANIEVNKFEGAIKVDGNMGNFKIGNGKISGDSHVIVKAGNISIKAAHEENKSFRYETDIGNVDLLLPVSSKISIETIGTLEVNEFAKSANTGKVTAISKMGKISIKKY